LFLHGAHCHAAAVIAIAGATLRRQRAKKSKKSDRGKDDGVEHERNSVEPRKGSSGARFKKGLTPDFYGSRDLP
jgi:hypothetical protein